MPDDEDFIFVAVDELVPAPTDNVLLPTKPEEDEEALDELEFKFPETFPAKPPLDVLFRLCGTDEGIFPPVLLVPDPADVDCLVAFEDLRCFDDDEDDDDDNVGVTLVVILMLVADVEEAIALTVESISFSGDDPESEDVSWLMGL